MKQIPSLTEAKCACSMNACCPELMAIVLLWYGGVRGLTRAATFTHGLFRDCSLMLDSTAGKIILAAALYVKSLSKPHSCSQLAWWKWSVSPSDPQNRQKTVGSLPILCLAHEVLGPGHLHCRCPENPPQMPSGWWSCPGVWGSLQAACQRLAGGRHCSLLCTTIIPPIKSLLSWGCSAGQLRGSSDTHSASSLLSWFPSCCGHSGNGFSKGSAPESLIFSPSAIRSWVFAYLIWGRIYETYLCWNMAFLLSPLICILPALGKAGPVLCCSVLLQCSAACCTLIFLVGPGKSGGRSYKV